MTYCRAISTAFAAEVTLRYGFRYFTVLRAPSRPMELETREVPVQDEPRKWRTVVVEAPSEETLLMPIQCFKDPPQPPDTPLIDARAYLDKRTRD